MTDSTPALAPRPSRLHDLQEWAGYAAGVAAAYLGFVPAGRALLLAGVILVVTANAKAAASRPRKPRRFDRMVTAAASFIAAYRAGGAT
jgi:hypothetical protein